jgi:hypothetical protein
MKITRLAFASALILLGFVTSETALAGPHGGHVHSGFHGGARVSLAVGFPVGFGYGYYGYYGYYPPPYYSPYYAPYSYYPPVAAMPYAAPTYIEQGSAQSAPAPAPQASPGSQNFWYYCAESKAYYPYVNQCPGGWQRVSPTPPSG